MRTLNGAKSKAAVEHVTLVEKSLAQADLFDMRGQPNLAAMARSFAAELDAWARQRALESLTLKQAAAESGYSDAHLSRLLAEGRLENAGRKGAPRIRRQQLPRKPAAASHSGEPDLVGYVLREVE